MVGIQSHGYVPSGFRVPEADVLSSSLPARIVVPTKKSTKSLLLGWPTPPPPRLTKSDNLAPVILRLHHLEPVIIHLHHQFLSAHHTPVGLITPIGRITPHLASSPIGIVTHQPHHTSSPS
ncbi:hypothetical protein PGTUg99_012542 [Puccinia graminis f. sp. tritici]|uniref:Uncharacterized protein n=1 Tax=Puccinia graminis f. sp. tritici TaxID=56615 RepID=A0A5B0QHM4_PUCGR|nr:hypothetical protein PGTUg99_012542 [Puccinia graminis f. sp. tritici]